MCGISGIFRFHRAYPEQQNQRIKKMMHCLQHRGPDHQGQWHNEKENIYLGHNRLAIIDLHESAHQPMHYMDRYTIVFNGEIYNYIELREQLRSKGVIFRTNSDTEVLLAAYHLYKTACIYLFDGQFAFALWDEDEQQLIIGRDRFGEKPFYFFSNNEEFVFASEMKALWAAGISKEINKKAFVHFAVSDEIDENPTSYYPNIHKLPAAHYAIIKSYDPKVNFEQYWHINIEETCKDELHTATKKVLQLLQESVKLRLRADVPIGSSLSGGVDSSIIVYLIQKLNEGAIQHTFSAIFPSFHNDESSSIKKYTSALSLQAHFIEPKINELTQDFEKLMYHHELPIGSSSCYAQWCVNKLAQQNNITVLLDGQGADEVFAGYYYRDYLIGLLKKDKKLFDEEYAAQSGYNMYPISGKYILKIAHYGTSFYNWYINYKKNRRAVTKAKYMLSKEAFHDLYMPLHAQLKFKAFIDLQDSLHNSIVGGGLETLLRYADRNAMAWSRELRLPYLSHELVEYVFSLPENIKINNGITKYILRNAFDKKVNDKILWNRNKIGFETPQYTWLRDNTMKQLYKSQFTLLQQDKILSSKLKPQEVDWNWLVASSLMT